MERRLSLIGQVRLISGFEDGNFGHEGLLLDGITDAEFGGEQYLSRGDPPNGLGVVGSGVLTLVEVHLIGRPEVRLEAFHLQKRDNR